MKKILYVSGTRADYGLMKSALMDIKNHSNLQLEILVTGMHLMKKYGHTFKEIKNDGFKIKKVKEVYKKDDYESMAIFLGNFVKKLTTAVSKIKPDIILILGDRAEALGTAIVGAYLNIPVAHLHGGEVSSTVDEIARHAITKLSHIHLTTTEKSAERILKMGEKSSKIYVVGAPGLDQMVNQQIAQKEELFEKLGLKNEKTILVIQHPVTLEIESAEKQMEETLNAIKKIGLQNVIIYPNADAGNTRIINVINKFKNEPNFKIFKNLDHFDYLSLLNYAEIIVGNSSSGIIEAASFKKPVINIGTRQKGRERTFNVIDSGHSQEEIIKSIELALSPSFKEKIKECINPYGEGNTGMKISKILSEIEINPELLQKQITY
jgi:GDP/UDP-N,N'-diacetylbacillosamine 2-epimerase (hydrolysing)